MNENEEYIRNAVRQWVWSGFYDAARVHEMVEDIMEDDVDEETIYAAIDAEFERKAEEERSWPAVTDCDRLDKAFATLGQAGICALQNAGYTMSDGLSDIAEALDEHGRERYHGYCFYHGQDVERAIDGHGLMLAFGDLHDTDAGKVAVGLQVKAVFEQAGFVVDWDGTAARRLGISRIAWKRRNPRSRRRA